MLLTVDRIEENTVVLIDNNQKIHKFLLSAFTVPPCEGDIFELSYNEGTPVFTLKPEIRIEREEKIKSRFERLLKRK